MLLENRCKLTGKIYLRKTLIVLAARGNCDRTLKTEIDVKNTTQFLAPEHPFCHSFYLRRM